MGIGLMPSRWKAYGPYGKLIGFNELLQPKGACPGCAGRGKNPTRIKASIFLNQTISVISKTQDSGTAKKEYLGHQKLQTYFYNYLKPNLSLPHPRRQARCPSVLHLSFLGNSPRCDLATWYFPLLFPVQCIQELILSNTPRAVQTRFGACKSPALLMGCSGQGHVLTYTSMYT